MNVLDYNFTFETDTAYWNAKLGSPHMEYNVVRIRVVYPDGYDVDYPVHSREDLTNELARLNKVGANIKAVYPSEHYHDIFDYSE